MSAFSQWQSDNGSIAAFAGFATPELKAGFLQDVFHHTNLACPNRRAHRTAPAFGVGPGDLHGLKISLFEACLRHYADAAVLVVLRKANPGHAVPGNLHHCFADQVEQFALVAGPYQGLVALAERLQGPLKTGHFALVPAEFRAVLTLFRGILYGRFHQTKAARSPAGDTIPLLALRIPHPRKTEFDANLAVGSTVQQALPGSS